MRTKNLFANSALFRALVLAVLAGIHGGAALAAEAAAETPKPPEVFDIAKDPDFSAYRQPLADFLKTKRTGKANSFCILGERAADGSKSASIIWREGNKIILWDGNDEPLAASRRILDLKRDVVRRDADIKGSNYLVTRAWVARLKARCEKLGTKVNINKSELNPAKE